MRVQDIMTSKFVSLQADDGLDRILEAFAAKGVCSAPVLSKGEFVGVISCADLVRFFTSRDSMWPFSEAGRPDAPKANASAIARRPPSFLTPDQPVQSVLGKIASSQECIPVMDGKKLVGLVWPQGIVDFFLAERAKDEVLAKKKGAGPRPKQSDAENTTAVDRVLEIVKRDGATSPRKVAAELGITESTAEDLGKLLGKHKLVDISYSFLAGMVMRRAEHGGK